MRGDIARLGRCTSICTQGEDTIRRSKPFKYAYEKEIVMCVVLLTLPQPSFCVNHSHMHSAHHSSTGMHTSKSLTTFRRSVYTLQMHTGDMHAHFSRISKRHGQVRSSILSTQERLSRSRRRSRLPRKCNVSHFTASHLAMKPSSPSHIHFCFMQKHVRGVGTCQVMPCARLAHSSKVSNVV